MLVSTQNTNLNLVPCLRRGSPFRSLAMRATSRTNYSLWWPTRHFVPIFRLLVRLKSYSYCMCVRGCVRACVCVYVCLCVCKCMFICARVIFTSCFPLFAMCACICVQMHACVCLCVCVCEHSCVNVQVLCVSHLWLSLILDTSSLVLIPEYRHRNTIRLTKLSRTKCLQTMNTIQAWEYAIAGMKIIHEWHLNSIL